jgi:YVTN family beta-propeller protein
MSRSRQELSEGMIRFGVLGPLTAVRGGHEVGLGARKQRALLAILLLHANEFVTTDRLIDGIWNERPPSTAGHSIQVYVSGLRKALESGSDEKLFEAQPGGYLLRLVPEQLDATQFEALVAEAKERLAAGSAREGAEILREAIGLWRGPALGDLAYEPFASPECERLEEHLLSAREELIDAELKLDRHSSLIGELQRLVAEHPLREHLRGQLMLALYRSGRQAEALAAYRDLRSHLVEELGIEPGPQLQKLEQTVLRQDPSLDSAQSAMTAPQAPADGVRSPRTRPRRRPIAALGVALLAGAIAVVLALGGSPGSLKRIRADSVGAVDADTGRILTSINSGHTPAAVVYGSGSLWVTSTSSDSVLQVDPRTGAVLDQIDVGNGPIGACFGGGELWVANSLDGTVSRIDPSSDRVVQTVQVGSQPTGIAIGAGSVWVTQTSAESVTRIDLRTGQVQATVPVGVRTQAIAAGAGAIWITDDDGRSVVRLDPGSNSVAATIGVGDGPVALAFAGGSLWAANSLDGTVSRIDPTLDTVTSTVPVGPEPESLSGTKHTLWVGDGGKGTLVQINPAQGTVTRSQTIGAQPLALLSQAGRVWVAAGADPSLHRGGTLAVQGEPGFDSPDPALAYENTSWALLSITSDALVGIDRTTGVGGTRLVPDLATALPLPADGGRTYTFRIRQGIRYSDGEPLQAHDFRAALERDFRLGSPALGYYKGIQGAAACSPGRPCNLSRGITVDDRARTISFHLQAPDPEFLYKLLLPFADAVPDSAPDSAPARAPLPSTGPYRVVSYTPGRGTTLGRNPRFHEWSAAAQPDGYPDRIVWSFGLASDSLETAVEHNRTGLPEILWGSFPRDRIAELPLRYPSRFYVGPEAGTLFLFLNTRVRPFSDVRVRRALNYAVDRRRLIQQWLPPPLGQLSCQVFPPNFPGYRPYCPYTVNPSPDGRWTGPDLARARRLVAESGTAGTRVTVWWAPPLSERDAHYVASVLDRLGYPSTVRKRSSLRSYFAAVDNPRTRAQIGEDGWLSDYPAASNFIVPQLSCRSRPTESHPTHNASQFCDPALDREMSRALNLEARDPFAANLLWTRIEHKLVDAAPVVSLGNTTSSAFVSAGVGNVAFNPLWHLLVDQLWVR